MMAAELPAAMGAVKSNMTFGVNSPRSAKSTIPRCSISSAVKAATGDRRVLQTFFTLAGSYYNFLQGAGLGKQFSGCSTKQAGKIIKAEQC